ncbi:MAG TPA: GxxExxY protein [Pyrinomonadaceae bacterium]|nr:GxxExxY protein [Pyrinomonadaceae bacterium]
MEEKIVYKDLSYKVVGLAIQAWKELGYGFLEKVYENALMILLEENGIKAEQQIPIKVKFHGKVVGDYIADILVEKQIILELKAQDKIADIHKAQTLNYLKATGLKLAIILNFGKDRLESERLVL